MQPFCVLLPPQQGSLCMHQLPLLARWPHSCDRLSYAAEIRWPGLLWSCICTSVSKMPVDNKLLINVVQIKILIEKYILPSKDIYWHASPRLPVSTIQTRHSSLTIALDCLASTGPTWCQLISCRNFHSRQDHMACGMYLLAWWPHSYDRLGYTAEIRCPCSFAELHLYILFQNACW